MKIKKLFRSIILSLIRLLYYFSQKKAIEIYFYVKMRRKLDLKNPIMFQDKIQWLKIYWQHPLVSMCADKILVRDYLKLKKLENIAVPLLKVYSDAEEISFDELPEKFVLKTNHACGTNIICTDKMQLNISDTKSQLNKWLKINMSSRELEPHYGNIAPYIICEEYIDDKNGILPTDYKIFCFNGEPIFINVIMDREEKMKEIILDIDWTPMDVLKEKISSKIIPRPICINEIFDICKQLAKPFPFVRIDFYIIGEKYYLGEMTFTPVGGYNKAFKDDYCHTIGNMITLPRKYSKII